MINKILLEFEAFFDDLKEIIIIVDESGLILYMNNTALDILSFNRDEILNKNISEICCDKTLENVIKCNMESFNVNLCSKYKKLIPVNGKLSVINTDKENLIIIKLFRTEEEIFTSIISNGNDRVEYSNFIKDISGRYLYIDEVYEKHFRVSKSEVLQKFDYEIWDKDASYKFRREDLYVISTKKTCVSHNTRIINNEVFYYETYKSPLLDGNNKVVGVLGIIKDITESIKLRNELVVQNEQLSIIYKILNNASSSINIMSLFSSLYKDFKALLSIDSICVFLNNFEKGELEYCTSYGLSQTFIDSYISSDTCRKYINEVYKSKIPVPMTNILEFGDEIKTKYTKSEGMNYCACYPLVYNDLCFGVAIFGCNSADYSNIWDNKFMEAVCKNISILLQNAMFYTKLEETLESEKEASDQINLYFDTTLDFFCIIDDYSYIKKISKHMLETLGYSEEEALSLPIFDFIHKDDKPMIIDLIRSFNKDVTSEFLIKVLCKSGEYRSIDWNVKYLEDRGIYICSGRDLTYKLELERKNKIVEESFQLELLLL